MVFATPEVLEPEPTQTASAPKHAMRTPSIGNDAGN